MLQNLISNVKKSELKNRIQMWQKMYFQSKKKNSEFTFWQKAKQTNKKSDFTCKKKKKKKKELPVVDNHAWFALKNLWVLGFPCQLRFFQWVFWDPHAFQCYVAKRGQNRAYQ